MDHMRSGNLSIVTNRSQEIPGMWSNILVTDEMAVHHAVSSKEINYQFPLYLYPPPEGSRRPKAQAELFGDGTDPFEGKERIENVASDFRQWLDARLGGEPASPEDILGYIYAVLHAPAYRCRYADFLRTDFPRVPFPESRADFDKLAALGWALVQAHLLKDVPKRGLGAYSGKGSDAVEKPRYDAGARKLCINPDKYFADVPEPVWHFTIGGYQVLDKWLKSRKGRTLSLDEQEHLENVINVLDFTIEQMELIDEAFLAFSQ